MTLSYRTRRRLTALGTVLLVLVLLLVVAWMIWLLWVDRYVVYTRDGAKLDFSLSSQNISGQVAVPPDDDIDVSIYYNEGDNTLNTSTELVQLYGYYIDAKMLQDDPDGILDVLKQLPSQMPIMIELKDITGRFLYPTGLGSRNTSVNQSKVQDILDYLRMSDLYTIARIPAFRDYYYGLEHVNDGLATSKGYLWMDDNRCYWLNPTKEGVINYLTEIGKEIKEMGFDEILYADFAFPETDRIVFKGDQNEALVSAAQRLLEACGSEQFAVSYLVKDSAFPLPEGRTRIYIEGRGAAMVKRLADAAVVPDKQVNLAFITDVNDTRFDLCGVLRPLTSADVEALNDKNAT